VARLNVAAEELSFGEATMPVAIVDGRMRLRVLIDRTSVEIFANQGQSVLSHVFCPLADERRVRLFAEGGSARATSLHVRTLRSIWR
jgi:sucrose-6-phosphate hydrolase SacC (GH32 family)